MDALIEIVASYQDTRNFCDFGYIRCVRAVAAAPEDALDSSITDLFRHRRLVLLEVPDVYGPRKLQHVRTRLGLLLERLEISLRLRVFSVAFAHRNVSAGR